jgi:hypothetical protein
VFVSSKQGGEVSLCNLRQAAPEEAALRRRQGHPDPTDRCLQCRRTLTSRVPNARMRRYLAEAASRPQERSGVRMRTIGRSGVG